MALQIRRLIFVVRSRSVVTFISPERPYCDRIIISSKIGLLEFMQCIAGSNIGS
jgi:hypothetical protein